jgi:GTP pyrophosphokinase
MESFPTKYTILMRQNKVYKLHFEMSEHNTVILNQLKGHAAALDRHGQRLVEHSEKVCERLEFLHLDLATLRVALLVSSEPFEPFEVFANQLLDSSELNLFKSIQRVRSLGPFQAQMGGVATRQSLESLRRLFMALAADTRAVLVLLASRLETLSFYAAAKLTPSIQFAQETLDVMAPLANRLGLWQMKWQLEDYGLRYSNAARYKQIASLLEEKRVEREAFISAALVQLEDSLQLAGIKAEVSGRAKHIYSIHHKMLSKNLRFDQVMDLRAARVIVDSIPDCYSVLSLVQSIWEPLEREFDDYIAKPKPNGYQSLHTVVKVNAVQTLEIQIRTNEMHELAEFGVAAHWRYKERTVDTTGIKNTAGLKASKKGSKSSAVVPDSLAPSAEQSATRQLAWMRQLLNWQQELGHAISADASSVLMEEHIFVFTPDATVVELPRGATAVDFAYHVHTNLGHRCRGAKIDGQMISLLTPLQTGQTIEIITAKSNEKIGPSRDWLNQELGYIASTRARSKVRSWFNAQALEEMIAQGRVIVEKTLQRESATSLQLDELAKRINFDRPELLFAAVAREEIGPRLLEETIREALGKQPAKSATQTQLDDDQPRLSKASQSRQRSDVLVVGVDLLLTQMARCCRPVPPDLIAGYVTKGKGISIHRQKCPSFRAIAERQPDRVLETAWDARQVAGREGSRYPAELAIDAVDRQGLLRDITDVLARQKINVTAVQSLTKGSFASIRMTIEVKSLEEVASAIAILRGLTGVTDVRRR